MKTAIFNIHDIALVLIIAECLILTALLLSHATKRKRSNLLLAIFLLLNGLTAIDVLTFWGEIPRNLLAAVSPDFIFIFNFAYFLQGPVLLFYTQSMTYKDFAIKKADLLHLAPALLCVLFMYFIYHRLSIDNKSLLMQKPLLLFDNPYYVDYLWVQKIVPVIYGFACLYHLFKYRVLLMENYSNLEQLNFRWLELLIGGFQLAWIWILLTNVIGIYVSPDIGDTMGILGNYFILVFINALVFYSSIYGDMFKSVMQSRPNTANNDPVIVENINKIESAMNKQKLFLNPRLTLETFSEQIALSPRLVSSMLNHHFNQNFFEFVNQYRIQEVKTMLATKQLAGEPLTTIYLKCGFNSKATFHRFFKKHVGMTPAEYRNKYNFKK